MTTTDEATGQSNLSIDQRNAIAWVRLVKRKNRPDAAREIARLDDTPEFWQEVVRLLTH